MRKMTIQCSVFIGCLLAPLADAQADGFEVRPITIESATGFAQVVVTNSGVHRLYLETHVLDWNQDAAGQERLTESDVAVVSPPGLWIQPRSSYTLRLKLPAPAAREQTFRVVLKQLPDRSDIVQGRIVFALTQSMPVFVSSAEPSAPAITARLLDPQRVLIENHGGRHVRITKAIQNGATLASGLLGYALAQGSLQIALPRPARPGSLDIETDLGTRTVALR